MVDELIRLRVEQVDNNPTAPEQFPHRCGFFVREQTDTVDAPEHNYYVREQVKSATPVTPCVREQKPVIQVAPEHTHWVEEYWVQRGAKKHKYFRYCWMEGRKIRRCHIGGGNVKSALVQQRKAAVEFALADGQTPSEIEKLIHSSR
ncbi:DUF4102 domain-containing protein [Nostoc sp. UHCC 0702]|nr:DUF4102 domain-containing protein [Nostoc sp. UHCC 0702]